MMVVWQKLKCFRAVKKNHEKIATFDVVLLVVVVVVKRPSVLNKAQKGLD